MKKGNNNEPTGFLEDISFYGSSGIIRDARLCTTIPGTRRMRTCGPWQDSKNGGIRPGILRRSWGGIFTGCLGRLLRNSGSYNYNRTVVRIQWSMNSFKNIILDFRQYYEYFYSIY